jgi:hypothetical protein
MSLASTLTDSLIYYVFCALVAVSATVLFGVAVNLARSAYPRRLRRFFARCQRRALPVYSDAPSIPFECSMLSPSHVLRRPVSRAVSFDCDEAFLGGFVLRAWNGGQVSAYVEKRSSKPGTGNNVSIDYARACTITNCNQVEVREGTEDVRLECSSCDQVDVQYVKQCSSVDAQSMYIHHCERIVDLGQGAFHAPHHAHGYTGKAVQQVPVNPRAAEGVEVTRLLGVTFKYIRATQTLVVEDVDYLMVHDVHRVTAVGVPKCTVTLSNAISAEEIHSYEGMCNRKETLSYCDYVQFRSKFTNKVDVRSEVVPVLSNTAMTVYHADF